MVIQKTIKAECPDCGEKVPIEAPVELGQRVVCPNCQADLEIVETVPVELDWYYEDEPLEDDEDEW